MFRSLRSKLTILVVILTTLATLLAGGTVAWLMQSSLSVSRQRQSETQAIALAELYGEQAEQVARGTLPEELPSQIVDTLTDADVWYVGVSFYPRGRQVLSSPDDLKFNVSDLEAVDVKQVSWVENGVPMIGAAAPVHLADQPVGAIIVASPADELPLMRQLGGSLLLAMIAAGMFGAVAVGWITGQITRPLKVLAQAAVRVRQGERDVHLDRMSEQRRDEVGELAASFEQMLTELAKGRQRDDQFFASVSHELRTPITIIAGKLAMIRDGVGDQTPDELLASALAQTSKLERMVADLVDLSRLRSGRFDIIPERLRVTEWGPYITTSWSELVPEGIRLASDWGDPGKDKAVNIDPERMEQVLQNLVRNAARYAEKVVVLSAEAGRKGMRITVQDDGPDLSKSRQEDLYQAFVSDGMPGGVGLGLIISKELCQAMDTSIRWVPPTERNVSALKGAFFELVIPYA